MDSRKAKPILIGIAIVCLVLAAVLMYRNLSTGAGAPLDRSLQNEPVAMYCLACNHNLEMPIREYQKLVTNETGPSYDCPSCSQKALQSGFKCAHCDTIFPVDFDRNPRLRCPGCGRGHSIE